MPKVYYYLFIFYVHRYCIAFLQVGSVAPRSYQIQETYTVGEVINHKTFGVGVVTDTEGPNKIRVLFETGPNVLACNRNL